VRATGVSGASEVLSQRGKRLLAQVQHLGEHQPQDGAPALVVGHPPPLVRRHQQRDTKHLEEFWASEPLLPELLAAERVEQMSELEPIRFDGQGMLSEAVPVHLSA
jgi:hypothetical protein